MPINKSISNNFSSRLISIGSFGVAFAIISGAFGAHYLQTKLSPSQLVSFETAARYQIYGCFGLLILSLIAKFNTVSLLIQGRLLLFGILIFCGSLYFLALKSTLGIKGFTWVGAITPIGGLCMISSWVWTALIFNRAAKVLPS